jgi:hypothetical protein
MFQKIEEYIQLSREERTQHVVLSEDCIEIGGADSRHYRGLLAHHLRTTIPSGMKIHLCHACNVHSCSNPHHMYWGTAKENAEDTRRNGKWKSIQERTRSKYGEQEFFQMRKEFSRKGGKANRGKQMVSNEYLTTVKLALDKVDRSKRGWVKSVSEEIDRTPQYTKRLVNKYFPIAP